jgi:FkbM family methyltransferase
MASAKLFLKKLLFRLGLQIVRQPHRGLDVCQDVLASLPSLHVEVIFDIGANVGQSLEHYLAWFPDAKVYCFEPSRSACNELKRAFSGRSKVEAYQVAMGSAEGVGVLSENTDLSVMNRLSNKPADSEELSEFDSVQIDTVDSFCHRHGIKNINYLKTDTEGFELDVLAGASKMLENDCIDFVEVEVGMYPGNSWHVPFESVKRLMEQHGYLIFGVYDQVHEWTLGQPHLRRVNVAFISDKTAKSLI